ncbi:hypothetical protein AAFF_G00129870 [Aldrovandia affinis]|uniref:Uncharacterized protein n=1 Tax=Aldrovandia affinis TaxID=143900 RepID=A0AAD7WAE0_9TELE|nr:hypothetical protein AAFF_G00129870 [Aldrovandia affinis]
MCGLGAGTSFCGVVVFSGSSQHLVRFGSHNTSPCFDKMETVIPQKPPRNLTIGAAGVAAFLWEERLSEVIISHPLPQEQLVSVGLIPKAQSAPPRAACQGICSPDIPPRQGVAQDYPGRNTGKSGREAAGALSGHAHLHTRPEKNRRAVTQTQAPPTSHSVTCSGPACRRRDYRPAGADNGINGMGGSITLEPHRMRPIAHNRRVGRGIGLGRVHGRVASWDTRRSETGTPAYFHPRGLSTTAQPKACICMRLDSVRPSAESGLCLQFRREKGQSRRGTLA